MSSDGEVGPGASSDAAFRRVSDFLAARGVTEEEITLAREDDVLHLLVADHLVLPTPGRYGPEDVIQRTGLDRPTLERLWRAMGFAAVADGEKVFSDIDIEAVQATAAFVGAGLVDFDEIAHVTRVVGSSMARIADAEVASMPTLRNDADSLTSADLLVSSEGLPLTTIARLLEYVWRRQMQAALRRAAASRSGEVGDRHGRLELTVGFADLVGYTALSQQLSDAALSELVSRFETLAHDTIVSAGGRVVKMIGDEVMFVIDDPGGGVDLALALAEAYAHDELLSDVRVGLACGPVLARDGDFYGPTVNMASRIVTVARPGTVVTSGRVHQGLAGDHRFMWKAIRNRHLKDLGRVDLHVAQRRPSGAAAARITERARQVGEDQMRALLPDAVRERYEDRVRDRG
jgi:adenylate cyclase